MSKTMFDKIGSSPPGLGRTFKKYLKRQVMSRHHPNKTTAAWSDTKSLGGFYVASVYFNALKFWFNNCKESFWNIISNFISSSPVIVLASLILHRMKYCLNFNHLSVVGVVWNPKLSFFLYLTEIGKLEPIKLNEPAKLKSIPAANQRSTITDKEVSASPSQRSTITDKEVSTSPSDVIPVEYEMSMELLIWVPMQYHFSKNSEVDSDPKRAQSPTCPGAAARCFI